MINTIRCLYLYFSLTLQANTMLITNASNLMKGVVGTLKAAESASVKVYVGAYFSGTNLIRICIMLIDNLACCSRCSLNLLLKKECVKISHSIFLFLFFCCFVVVFHFEEFILSKCIWFRLSWSFSRYLR